MAVSYTKILIGILALLIATSVIYIQFRNDAKIRVDADKASFYVKEGSYWKTSGVEYSSIYNGTTKLVRKASEITVKAYYFNTEWVEVGLDNLPSGLVKIVRVTPYAKNISMVETWLFDGSIEDIQLFPISHTIELNNAQGYYF